jgi:hypothetical protein
VDDKGFFKDFSGSSDSDSLAIPSEEIIGNNISMTFPHFDRHGENPIR